MPIYDRWILAEPAATVPGLVELSPALAQIAHRRCASGNLREFLHPALEDLHDGATIAGIGEACERIAAAVRNREAILIYGDYDVDGVTSILLLRYAIGAIGGDVDHVVPHRLVDGYGLKMSVLERVLVDRNIRLVITVDCGVTSVEPVEAALARGIDVIITDHHLPPERLPQAVAVLNPRKEGCHYPFKDLAGVGVALKLACELLKRSGKPLPLESLLRIAAIGTIADVAPLIGENRTIARLGLSALSTSRNAGLRAMLRAIGAAGRPVRAADVGFRIGPRINAAGRLASADTAIELFSCRSDSEADAIVQRLEELNQQRRTIEKKMIGEAERMISSMPPAKGYIVHSEGWHRGVLGLCASRLAQAVHRPVLAIGIDGDECVGSGRSIDGVDLHGILERCSDLFTHFGGHEYACGFTLSRNRLDELIDRFRDETSRIDEIHLERSLRVDAPISFSQLTPRFLDELMLLEPFGAANPRPLFQSEVVEIEQRREFATDCFNLAVRHDGELRTAVLWPSARKLAPILETGARVALAFAVEPDGWGRMGMQLEVIDARAADGSE